jgi:hypothetical protein
MKSFGIMAISVLGVGSRASRRTNHLKLGTRERERVGAYVVPKYYRYAGFGSPKNALERQTMYSESGGHASILTMTLDLNIWMKSTPKTTTFPKESLEDHSFYLCNQLEDKRAKEREDDEVGGTELSWSRRRRKTWWVSWGLEFSSPTITLLTPSTAPANYRPLYHVRTILDG